MLMVAPCPAVVISVALVVGFGWSSQAIAGDPVEFGWWANHYESPAEMGSYGAPVILAYHNGSATNDTGDMLDEAQANGIKMILELPREPGTELVTDDVPTLQAFVNAYKDHSALYGFESLDEPVVGELGRATTIYTTVKALTSKPVSMVFSGMTTTP